MKTMEALSQKHRDSLSRTKAAILRRPRELAEIRGIINRVALETVDIDAYYPLAEKLARLLASFGRDTIFSQYFLENIDPDRGCQARYFRYICLDLLEQINQLMRWSDENRRLRLL